MDGKLIFDEIVLLLLVQNSCASYEPLGGDRNNWRLLDMFRRRVSSDLERLGSLTKS